MKTKLSFAIAISLLLTPGSGNLAIAQQTQVEPPVPSDPGQETPEGLPPNPGICLYFPPPIGLFCF